MLIKENFSNHKDTKMFQSKGIGIGKVILVCEKRDANLD